MAEWLRPVFQRTSSASFLDDNNNMLRPASRVSSYLNFRPGTPSVSTPDSFPNIRTENVYYAPSGDQIAETVQVALMTRSAKDPLPVEYNASILHLLEAYHNLKEQLNSKDQVIEDLKRRYAKDVKDFEELAKRWLAKERDYRIELKKLEVLLSKTDAGLEAVSLARSKSVLHETSMTVESIGLGIKHIKEKDTHCTRQCPGEAIDSRLCTFPSRTTTGISIDFQHQTFHSGDPTTDSRTCITQGRQKEKIKTPGAQDNSLLGIARLPIETLEMKQTKQHFGVASDSPQSSQSFNEGGGYQSVHGSMHKPLPNTSNCKISVNAMKSIVFDTDDNIETRPWVETVTPEGHALPPESFSFRPGDDIYFAHGESTRDEIMVGLNEEHMFRRNVTDPTSGSEVCPRNSEEFSPLLKAGTMKPGSTSNSSGQGNINPVPCDLKEDDKLKRDNSSSSVVTAIRDNSGRSTTSGSHNSQFRAKLNRHTGSSDATLAAIRAIAASDNKYGSNVGASKAETASGNGAVDK